MKIVSWNIAGGRKINSLNHLDYGREDLLYFVEQLKNLDPDIVCFQESHTNSHRTIALEIGTALGLNNCFNSPASPSHVDPDFQLGLAIISKYKFAQTQELFFPDPEFQLHWPDGRLADTHHKLLQQVKIDQLLVGNTQMLPLKLFGYSWQEGVGRELASDIDLILEKIDSPAVVCGDFNFDSPPEIYPKFIQKITAEDSLPDETTRPNLQGLKKRSDHIYLSQGLKKINSGVVKTDTDHYLCWTEFN